MRRPWFFDEHPVGRRLLGIGLVAVAIFAANSAIHRHILGAVAVGGELYDEIREHVEARQEVTELAEEIPLARAQLASLLVTHSPDRARQILQLYAEQLASIDARFAEALGSKGLEGAAPVLQSAHARWEEFERAARAQLLREGAPPTQEAIAVFLDGKEARRYERLMDLLEAAGNALRLEEAAHEEEATRAVEQAQLLLDVITGSLGVLLLLYLLRSAGAVTHSVAREAQQAHVEALRADITGTLSGEGSLPEALQRCAQALVRHLDARLVRVWLLAPGEPRLELQGSAGTAPPPGSAAVPLASEQGVLWSITREMRPYTSGDVANDTRLGPRDWALREGIRGFVGSPLRVGNRPVGALELYTAELPEEHAIAALGAISDALAQGIERWRAELELAEKAKELERSNVELERFAYVASHDLQEPLRMVASYTQLLSRRYKDKLDEDANTFIHYAVDGATRMQRLLKDLLTYSRAGTQQKALVPTASQGVYERALDNLQAAVAERGATVAAGELPVVMGDEVQLEQLFQNLIGNAIKFQGDRPPEVRVAAEQREDGQWLFSVRDNGIGISPEHFPRLFVVFQRLETATAYPGTGIGLAICKKIVEQHGGRIWVESAPGQGATFYFTLKSTVAAAPALAAG